MKQVQKVLLSGKKDILEVSAVFGVGLVIVEIILAILLRVAQIDIAMPLGALLMVSIGSLVGLLTSAAQMALNMNRAVKFGIPRKDALVGTIGISFGIAVCGLLFSGLGLGLDIVVYWLVGFTGDFSPLSDILGLIGLSAGVSFVKIIGIVLLAFVFLSVIMGALILRFGKTGFWVVYFIIFGSLFLNSRIGDIINENTIGGKLIQILSTTVPSFVWWILGAAVVVAVLVWAIKTALQLEVNDAFS